MGWTAGKARTFFDDERAAITDTGEDEEVEVEEEEEEEEEDDDDDDYVPPE